MSLLMFCNLSFEDLTSRQMWELLNFVVLDNEVCLFLFLISNARLTSQFAHDSICRSERGTWAKWLRHEKPQSPKTCRKFRCCRDFLLICIQFCISPVEYVLNCSVFLQFNRACGFSCCPILTIQSRWWISYDIQ